MRFTSLIVAPLAVHAVNVVLSNDDGWAEANIRAFYNSLTAAGYNTVLSAPAENQSGTSSNDSPPTVRTSPCQFNSCPANSPATGFNASNPRLNYVNSFPVTSMKHAITTVGPKFFNNAKPDLALSGPNVGFNPSVATQFSGTVGAAVYAAKDAGIPSIAFSGKSGDPTAWNANTPLYSRVYADLAVNITNAIVASGKPYLPANTFLNVNFPEVSTRCASAAQFKFVLTRVNPAVPLITRDVETCGSSQLPWELTVLGRSDCFVSISVGDANDKTTASREVQALGLAKLKKILSCLP